MGYIKEPAGINFVVDPTPLTIADRKRINEIITYYKATGRKMPSDSNRQKTSATKHLSIKTTKKRVLA